MAPAAWDPPLWRSPQEGLKWLQVWVKVSWAERWAPHGPGCTCWLFACSGRTSVWWDSCSWIPCLLSLRRDGPKVPSAALWGEEPGPGFNDCNFVICFSMRRSGVSRFVFLSQGCFSYSESFVVAYDFYDNFSISVKNVLGFALGTSLNVYITSGGMVIFKTLIFQFMNMGCCSTSLCLLECFSSIFCSFQGRKLSPLWFILFLCLFVCLFALISGTWDFMMFVADIYINYMCKYTSNLQFDICLSISLLMKPLLVGCSKTPCSHIRKDEKNSRSRH